MNTTATEKQIAFINDLLNKKVVPTSVINEIENTILDKATASQFIDLLKGLPYRQKATAPKAQTVAHPAPVRDLPNGYYTVTDGEGGWVTFRVRHEAWSNGKKVIAYLNGTDNTRNYKGFAFITPTGLVVWNAHKDDHRRIGAAQLLLTGSVDEARAEFLNHAEAYALASGRCACCGRLLTVPASVHRGLGPDCFKNYGFGGN